MTAQLISIIGPPAVGKTTLARSLSAELPAELVREDFAGNPFLAGSYTGQDDARLPAQLHFLLSRVGQLSRAAWPDRGRRVSDYGFCQDRIFASRRLAPDDLAIYDSVARRVEGIVKPPDVLIVLDAGVGTLMGRIRSRGRGYEAGMTSEFLAGMRDAYGRLDTRECPTVLHVDCDVRDVRDPAVRRELIAAIPPCGPTPAAAREVREQ